MIRATVWWGTGLCLTGLILAVSCSRHSPVKQQTAVEYIDTKQCRGCHAAIYDSYQHVGMAQAFTRAGAANPAEDFDRANHFEHPASRRRYEVIRRDNRIFQRRYEIDGQGREVNAYQLEATHVVGSGRHARTYLHRSASGEFIELPLTWYSQEKRWALSPGFDNPRPPDFSRIIDDRCLFCHNGYPQSNGELASGIDCQRCHGPGSRHVAIAGSGGAKPEELAASIVNPAKLPSELQLDVCMQCHLETTSAELPAMIRRFDRSVYSFRPGEPLGNYVVHFDEAEGTGRPEKFEIASQAYRLRQSACFLKSGSRLTCTTCHNPHDVARGERAIALQREKCISCHSSVGSPQHPALASANCASCHMPQRRTEDAVHVVMTDHRIQRRPRTGSLTAPLREEVSPRGRPALFYPSKLPPGERDLYLAVALVVNGEGRRDGIRLLSSHASLPAKAAAVLGEAYVAEGDAAKAIAALRQAMQQDPSLLAGYNLGQAYELAGDLAQAAEAYRSALQSRPALPEAEYALANVLQKTGDRTAAVEHYRKAIQLRPTYSEAHGNLGSLLADMGELVGARTELEEALRINPVFADAHVNLARVLANQKDMTAALAHAQQSVTLDPKNALAHYNLGQLLQHQNSNVAALAEYRAAIGLRPDWAEPHLTLGQLLGDMGQLDGAIAEFREVLRLQPTNPQAAQYLQMAIEMKRSGGR